MKKYITIFVFLLVTLNSCTFLFFNYRAKIVVEYKIHGNVDTRKLGLYIYEQASLEKTTFYSLDKSENFDSLVFYGPDYHTLYYNIKSQDSITIIKFDYFGYNGWRGNPPRKSLIEKIRNKLMTEYQAVETIKTYFSNEKKRKKKEKST